MTRLHHLQIEYNVSMIQLCDVPPLEQIRILDVPRFSSSLSGNNTDLSSLFPCVEYLTIGLSNIDQMAHLIDGLRHLSSASFHITNGLDTIDQTFITEPDAIHTWLREKDNHFTYRVDCQSGIWIHLWVSNEPIQLKKLTEKQLKAHRNIDCQCGCSLQ